MVDFDMLHSEGGSVNGDSITVQNSTLEEIQKYNMARRGLTS